MQKYSKLVKIQYSPAACVFYYYSREKRLHFRPGLLCAWTIMTGCMPTLGRCIWNLEIVLQNKRLAVYYGLAADRQEYCLTKDIFFFFFFLIFFLKFIFES